MEKGTKEIGIATLSYTQSGEFINATFKPTMVISVDDNLMKNFEAIDCNKGEQKVKEQAQNVFASWFQAMNDIELADREQYEITTNHAGQTKYWGNGKIKEVSIKFIFKPIKQ